MFSNRLPPHGDVNTLSQALARLRAAGVTIVDLTESNPTRVGLEYPKGLLTALSAENASTYDPKPLGTLGARHAVALDYARRGAHVEAEQVVLSASSSEAYSWIFKLLCDPGDAVLVPRPSYPLFEHLTRLEAVRAVPYPLQYHGRWEIDMDVVTAAPAGVRAVLVVSPNNPTGSFVSPREFDQLARVCRARGWALVVDEVFADYALDASSPATECALGTDGVLSFTLGGASKSLGLPQVKLGWMVIGGPSPQRDRTLAALEIIADTYLSVSTPVQVAAPALLGQGEVIRRQIRARLERNLSYARDVAEGFSSCTVLPVEGGWSLVVRVPATRPEETLVLDLLERDHVLVHPGYFFDFAHEAFVVLSLLPREDEFAKGFERTLRSVCGEPLRR